MSNYKFWSAQKVLVTGATGFVGSHLIQELIKHKAVVYTFGRHKIKDNLILEADTVRMIKKEVIGDVRHKSAVMTAFKTIQPTICFHLAAQPLVELGEEEPETTFLINTMGTVHVLEAARMMKTQKIILASSAHIYGLNKTPLLETYPPQPSRPYETSKVCADIVAQTYATYYHLPVLIARLSNIYGPGDTNQRLIPRTIALIRQNKAPVIYNKQVIRDYIYIDDAIKAYLLLAEKSVGLKNVADNVIFNFGSGQKYTTDAVVRQILKLMHRSDLKPVYDQTIRSDEILDQSISIQKARKKLGWTGSTGLRAGLDKTIKWYLTQKLS